MLLQTHFIYEIKPLQQAECDMNVNVNVNVNLISFLINEWLPIPPRAVVLLKARKLQTLKYCADSTSYACHVKHKGWMQGLVNFLTSKQMQLLEINGYVFMLS